MDGYPQDRSKAILEREVWLINNKQFNPIMLRFNELTTRLSIEYKHMQSGSRALFSFQSNYLKEKI